MSTSTIGRWLAADAIRPWQHRSWIFPRDPDFAAKAGRVLDLYQRRWNDIKLGEDEYVISADEKSQLQALRRRHPETPEAPGRPRRVEFEYRRGGTLAYFAAYDVHHDYADRPGKRGRKAKPIETMLRMYLLQAWFSLSDEGVEDAIYDSYAMRRFMRLDFAVEQVPDATTLLHFRHLLEEHKLGEKLFAAQNEIFEREGWIMHGGSIIDATIIAAPSSTKNATGTRDPEMHQTRKGNQWYFQMLAHVGVDAGTGYAHSVTATDANVHDLDEAPNLVRADDEAVYADYGYQGAAKRPGIAGHEHLSRVEWRIAARKGALKTMPAHDRAVESRQAAVRAKVEHPFLIVKRDFGFTKTRYRGIAKNLNHLHVLFASANWLMRARAVALTPAAA